MNFCTPSNSSFRMFENSKAGGFAGLSSSEVSQGRSISTMRSKDEQFPAPALPQSMDAIASQGRNTNGFKKRIPRSTKWRLPCAAPSVAFTYGNDDIALLKLMGSLPPFSKDLLATFVKEARCGATFASVVVVPGHGVAFEYLSFTVNASDAFLKASCMSFDVILVAGFGVVTEAARSSVAASDGCDFSVGGNVKAAFIDMKGNSPLTAPSFGLTTTIAWSPTLRVALPLGCKHVASHVQRTSPKFVSEAALRASTIRCSHCFTKALSSVESVWA
mmetsp:Transcript_19856/g.56443  ORF Transcript_19856/g.56443 Transcript_19856/m.56443 type:complete len:275 (+) Transcript_19856:358-1182(+)